MQTRGIDFAALSLMDALDLAVLIEEEAEERYEEFAHQMDTHDTPVAAGFFRFMSANERKHGDELRARRKALFGDAPSALGRTMLFDVEAPDYDEARAFMSPRQALYAALASELKAYTFFVAVLPSTRDPDVKRLFEELRDEETVHQRLVHVEIAKLPPGEDVGDAFADEPVAH